MVRNDPFCPMLGLVWLRCPFLMRRRTSFLGSGKECWAGTNPSPAEMPAGVSEISEAHGIKKKNLEKQEAQPCVTLEVEASDLILMCRPPSLTTPAYRMGSGAKWGLVFFHTFSSSMTLMLFQCWDCSPSLGQLSQTTTMCQVLVSHSRKLQKCLSSSGESPRWS